MLNSFRKLDNSGKKVKLPTITVKKTIGKFRSYCYDTRMKKLLALSMLLVSCEAQEYYEQISYSQFYQEVLNDEIAKVIYDNEDSSYIRGWRLDGSKFETSRPLLNDSREASIIRNLAQNGVTIEYRDFDKEFPISLYIFPFLIILIFIFFPILSAFLASSRGQSKALWFFLTLIFPFAVLFIAMKDKEKKAG